MIKIQTVLGIDPGIANTGIAVVSMEGAAFALQHSELIKTKPSQSTGERLGNIARSIYEVLDAHDDITCVAIEMIFHNKNITSSLSTAKVIGIAELVSAKRGLHVLQFTPQQIKSASGMAFASKSQMTHLAKGLLKSNQPATHHETDAAFCAITGLLHLKLAKRFENGKNV